MLDKSKVKVNRLGPKLLEVEPKGFWGSTSDCIEALPYIQEKENVKSVFVVSPRLYLILE